MISHKDTYCWNKFTYHCIIINCTWPSLWPWIDYSSFCIVFFLGFFFYIFKRNALTVHSVELVSFYYKFFQANYKIFHFLVYILLILEIWQCFAKCRDRMPKIKLHCTQFFVVLFIKLGNYIVSIMKTLVRELNLFSQRTCSYSKGR